ncbi:carbohydrate kinase family protein [Candidatus Epulonipiscium viviparus]|uniref:carbohydrate kinase family protein n=1 Tax=Candidatus Epulonipiscium viviparus TaxID=420336 RepID=UPI00273814C7|nr:carbohydrate kinase [Candidatus Epulopiscium viviparus]
MITALGEILIDYTAKGKSEAGMDLFEQNAGGAPANVLACLAKLGIPTAFIGKIGDDMQGKFLYKTLEDAGINVSGLIVDKNYFTTLAFVSLSETGERNFAFARKPGADTMLNKEELNSDILAKTKIFHFGSLSLTHEPSREATYVAIKFAKKNGAIISYDPNYRALLWESKEIAKEQMRLPLQYVDVLKISDEECELLTDEKDIYKACEHLLKKGIKIVVITLGKDGALVGYKNDMKKIKGFASNKVVDTTGAGDSFWGGFLYSLYNKDNLSELSIDILSRDATFANAVASLCIENFGAIKAMPTLEQVNRRLRGEL